MAPAATLVAALILGASLLAGTPAAVPTGGAADAAAASAADATLTESINDVQVLVLKNTCDDACQADTVAQAEAAGCDHVRLFPTLRMAAVRCAPAAARDGSVSADASSGGGVDLARLPGVESTSPDAIVRTGSAAGGSARVAVDGEPAAVRQAPSSVPWGLDRINQAALPLDGQADTSACFPRRGAGVTVYVVDSGINAGHAQFEERASGVVAPGATYKTAEDLNGHGSHVAGTVAGKSTGVAPAATVVGVRGSDANGDASIANLLSGIEYVAAIKTRDRRRKVVLNGSFGGDTPATVPWTVAAERAAAAGVIVAVAAGNDPVDACRNNPARAAGVLTVAALTEQDQLASFSARGTRCVAAAAPGVGILSVDAFTPAGLKQLSGTSMASPHVAGLAALVLAEDPAGADLDAAEVLRRITRGAPTVGGYPLAWANPACGAAAGVN